MQLMRRVGQLEGRRAVREGQQVARYLAALRGFEDGEGNGGNALGPERPITTRAALLAALRAWVAAQWEGNAR